MKNGAETKRKVSFALNVAIALFSFLGVLLACIFARRDGYSSWDKRLLYFTQQSNIWIGVTGLLVALSSFAKLRGKPVPFENALGLAKYVFTVAITITGLIFCALLAPFAEYNVWSFSSVLTHVAVPVLSIVDFCCFYKSGRETELERKHVFLPLLPPLFYFVFAGALCLAKVDFGRGDAFPYFFMDFYSEAGFFGFINSSPPQLGTAYWLVFMLLLVLGFSYLYYRISKRKQNKA